MVLDPAGNVIAAQARCPQTATSWNRLFDMLSGAFGARALSSGQGPAARRADGDGVTAHFADGSTAVGRPADRRRRLPLGRARRSSLPEAQPHYAGYVAWRGLIDERARGASRCPQDLFGSLVFFLPPGEQFLGYPVAGPGNDLRPGHRSWNIVWYRPADEDRDVPRLLTDETGPATSCRSRRR